MNRLQSLLPTKSVKKCPICFFTFFSPYIKTPNPCFLPTHKVWHSKSAKSPGVLQLFSRGCLLIFADACVREVVSQGYKLGFHSVPLPQFLTCNFPVSPYRLTDLCQALSVLLIRGVMLQSLWQNRYSNFNPTLSLCPSPKKAFAPF